MNDPLLINLPISIPVQTVNTALASEGLALIQVGARPFVYRIAWIPESILGDTTLEARALRIERDQLRDMLLDTVAELAELRARQ